MKNKVKYFLKNLNKSKYVALIIILISAIELAIIPSITSAPVVFIVILIQIIGAIIAFLVTAKGVKSLNADIKIINEHYENEKQEKGSPSIERNDSIESKADLTDTVAKDEIDFENNNVKDAVTVAIKEAKNNIEKEETFENSAIHDEPIFEETFEETFEEIKGKRR